VLTISVPLDAKELYDESTETFFTSATKFYELEMEHSLVSLSKWESFFEKSFMDTEQKTQEEIFWYVKAMTLTQNVPPDVFDKLSDENVNTINDYVSAKMTATTFREAKPGRNLETVTAELIYYWMIALNIPFECQFWHLNRLLTLVRVCNVKNTPPKKLSAAEATAQRRAENERRRAELGSRG
jgi:hypothetical protein